MSSLGPQLDAKQRYLALMEKFSQCPRNEMLDLLSSLNPLQADQFVDLCQAELEKSKPLQTVQLGKSLMTIDTGLDFSAIKLRPTIIPLAKKLKPSAPTKTISFQSLGLTERSISLISEYVGAPPSGSTPKF